MSGPELRSMADKAERMADREHYADRRDDLKALARSLRLRASSREHRLDDARAPEPTAESLMQETSVFTRAA